MNNRGDLINGAVLGSGNNSPIVLLGASTISCGAAVAPFVDPGTGQTIGKTSRLRAAGLSLLGAIVCRVEARSRISYRLRGHISAQAVTSFLAERKIGRIKGRFYVRAEVAGSIRSKGLTFVGLSCGAAVVGKFSPRVDRMAGGIAVRADIRGVLAELSSFQFYAQVGTSVRGRLSGGEIYYG